MNDEYEWLLGTAFGHRHACRAFEVDPKSIIDPGTAAWSEDDQPGDLDPRWEDAWADAVDVIGDATGG